jgi:hypothetical protein
MRPIFTVRFSVRTEGSTGATAGTGTKSAKRADSWALVHRTHEELVYVARNRSSDFARDDHEALAVPDGIIHVGLGPCMCATHEKKVDIRRKPEWIFL